MAGSKQILLELDETDSQLLIALRDHLGVTQATLLRWALRYYALDGPWPISERELLSVLPNVAAAVEVGPNRRRVRK